MYNVIWLLSPKWNSVWIRFMRRFEAYALPFYGKCTKMLTLSLFKITYLIHNNHVYTHATTTVAIWHT